MSDGLSIEWTTATHRRRRVRFKRCVGDGWERIEEEYSDGSWRRCGREIVTNVAVEDYAAILEEVTPR